MIVIVDVSQCLCTVPHRVLTLSPRSVPGTELTGGRAEIVLAKDGWTPLRMNLHSSPSNDLLSERFVLLDKRTR